MAVANVTLKGGDKAATALATLGKKLASGKHVKVGFLENATYQATVHKPKQGGLSVAQVAFWNEFGTVTSPPRPFFRTMISSESPGWGKAFAAAMKVTGNDSAKALALMGDLIKRELQDSIRSGSFSPLSQTTLVLRKMQDDDPNLVVTGKVVGEAARRAALGYPGATGDRARMLQDTQVMVQAVDYQVVK